MSSTSRGGILSSLHPIPAQECLENVGNGYNFSMNVNFHRDNQLIPWRQPCMNIQFRLALWIILQWPQPCPNEALVIVHILKKRKMLQSSLISSTRWQYTWGFKKVCDRTPITVLSYTYCCKTYLLVHNLPTGLQ